MLNGKPILGITMGDPAGIGPEIAVKALARTGIYELCNPLIIGDSFLLKRELEIHSPGFLISSVDSVKECSFKHGTVDVLDLKNVDLSLLKYGEISPMSGKAAFESVIKAIDLAMKNELDAIVTGPINKKSINEAGYPFSGHTEIFAHYTGTKSFAMLLVSRNLKIIHVTTHVSLREACEMITNERVYQTIVLLHEALIQLGFRNPKIGVAGLNPHSGENGLFGFEDKNEIEPAINDAIKAGYNVEGPVPSDTLFPKAIGGNYDGCVVMYHDQGHIPFKLAGFQWDNEKHAMKSVTGVNVTLGLPIIRTSVDHGTAFEIAGKGLASSEAMIEAIEYAVKLVKNRN